MYHPQPIGCIPSAYPGTYHIYFINQNTHEVRVTYEICDVDGMQSDLSFTSAIAIILVLVIPVVIFLTVIWKERIDSSIPH